MFINHDSCWLYQEENTDSEFSVINKANKFFSYGKLIKELWARVIGRKTQQGFPLLIDMQEADCRALSGFLTLLYAL